MIEILTSSNIDTNQWYNLVSTSKTASFFQTKECYDFYCSLSFLNPFLFGVAEDEKLVGLVCGYIIADGGKIKQFFSKRAIVPGGLLLDAEISENALNLLLAELKNALSRSAIYIEIRNYNDYSSFRTGIESNGFEYKAHLNFHVETPSLEQASKNLSTTKRRDVKLSKKQGAIVVDTKDSDDLKSFYVILENLYSNKIKTPLFPFKFFENIIKLESAHLFVIKFNDNVIGGSLCMGLNKLKLYEWFVCGEDGKYKNIYPSTLATWAAIEFAAENGFSYFDMMGAGKPNEGYGVREFKSKFGGELVEHGRYIHINQNLMYSIGKRAIAFLKNRK